MVASGGGYETTPMTVVGGLGGGYVASSRESSLRRSAMKAGNGSTRTVTCPSERLSPIVLLFYINK